MTVREAPWVEAERIVLRPWRKDDFRPWHAILQHPDVHKHFGPEPMNEEDCWRRLMAAVGGWQLNGFGGWAVERKSDSRLIGHVSLFTAWRDLQPQFGEEPEMGWMFAAETHGQGFASEACSAAVGWAEAALPATPLWAIIAPANQPSIKLAEKLGFQQIGETTYHDDPTLVFRREPWA